MRLLIVEDEMDMRNLLKERLQREGYAVDVCKNGEEAIEYLILGNYDGAIIDIMLPKMSGISVLKTIRRKKIFTPVMFLSALNEAEDIVSGLDSGADDYMTKPFDFGVLLARIRAMLRKSVGVHESVYRCGDLIVNESDMVILRVSDHGEGIPEKSEEKVFEAYYRSDEANQIEGYGLGLTLAKKIATHYGGDVELDNNFGGGSTFVARLHLPLI